MLHSILISYHIPLHYSFYIITYFKGFLPFVLWYLDFCGTCTHDLTSFSNGGISSDDCEAAVFRLSTCILCMGRPRGSTNARVEWNPDFQKFLLFTLNTFLELQWVQLDSEERHFVIPLRECMYRPPRAPTKFCWEIHIKDHQRRWAKASR